jgi:hypothetical protein
MPSPFLEDQPDERNLNSRSSVQKGIYLSSAAVDALAPGEKRSVVVDRLKYISRPAD